MSAANSATVRTGGISPPRRRCSSFCSASGSSSGRCGNRRYSCCCRKTRRSRRRKRIPFHRSCGARRCTCLPSAGRPKILRTSFRPRSSSRSSRNPCRGRCRVSRALWSQAEPVPCRRKVSKDGTGRSAVSSGHLVPRFSGPGRDVPACPPGRGLFRRGKRRRLLRGRRFLCRLCRLFRLWNLFLLCLRSCRHAAGSRKRDVCGQCPVLS